ncbi:MAG TPA: hypothetical protein VFC51_03290 [Chloroflexota bacterium]|nr:hypothetical protein [Chloroflexota bacterium]
MPGAARPDRRDRAAASAVIGDYTPRVEEGVTLSAYTLEVTDWLQHCFDLLESGNEDRIMSDPWYRRDGDRPPLSDEQVDAVVEALDKEYEYELGTYPGYHRNRSGANALPEFRRLSPRARRAMVEGIDRIVSKYRQKGHTNPAKQ